MPPNPQSTKRKNSLTISMPIDSKLDVGRKQISPPYRVGGLIWRLYIVRTQSVLDKDIPWTKTFIDCEGDGSSEMWRTKAHFQTRVIFNGLLSGITEESRVYASWKRDDNKFALTQALYRECPKKIVLVISTEIESFARRPIMETKSNHDVILVLDGKRFRVNKQELSSQSNYFNRLFFGGYKESKQDEIEIKNTNPEDFEELLKMMYGTSTVPITVENANRYLMMADMLDLQIVKEHVENFLLKVSTDIISIHRKFIMAEEYKLEVLKMDILHLYKNSNPRYEFSNKRNLLALKNSPEFGELSGSIKNFLFENARDLLGLFN